MLSLGAKTIVSILSWIALAVFLGIYVYLFYETAKSGKTGPNVTATVGDMGTAFSTVVAGYVLLLVSETETDEDPDSNVGHRRGFGGLALWGWASLVLYLLVLAAAAGFWINNAAHTPGVLKATVLAGVGLLGAGLGAAQAAK